MGNLISREALIADLMEEIPLAENVHIFKDIIENQETAFNLESVIAELEKKRDLYYAEMKKEKNKTDYFSGHIFDEYHNKGMAYNDCLEILKSSANATNEKIGW